MAEIKNPVISVKVIGLEKVQALVKELEEAFNAIVVEVETRDE